MVEVLGRLEDCPVTITIENGLGSANNFDLDTCRRFCERVNSRKIGITIDIGHLVDYVADRGAIHPLFEKGGAHRELSKCGPYLRHLHLHDSRPFEMRFSRHGGHNDHYPPFLGNIDWQDLFVALGELRYPGAFVFEPIGWFSERISAALTESSHDVRGDETDIIELVASFPAKMYGCDSTA
jgi:sugar phosphate isomerase/epimerase